MTLSSEIKQSLLSQISCVEYFIKILSTNIVLGGLSKATVGIIMHYLPKVLIWARSSKG